MAQNYVKLYSRLAKAQRMADEAFVRDIRATEGSLLA
jgi:hypothetical protein